MLKNTQKQTNLIQIHSSSLQEWGFRVCRGFDYARARGARAPAKYNITYNKEDIWLTGERRSNYGWFFVPPKIPFSWDCASVQWQHLRKPATRDGKRMARKQNSNQIGVQHTARILSRYQCARGTRSPAKYITYNIEDIWLTGERRSNYGRFFLPPKIPFSWDCASVQWQHLRKPATGW